MANKSIFKSIRGLFVPAADAVNEAGGAAYRMDDRQALAQYAATGCLNSTFYATGQTQLEQVLRLCQRVEPEFIARTALYARQTGNMKDLPALLCAVLSVKSPGLMAEIFDRVIDSPKMLRNFVQIIRSGAVGRKSLGSLPKRLIVQWIEKRTDRHLFVGSVGSDPSLADIVKMVHPKPGSPSRDAFFGYLIGRTYNPEALPELIREFETYKTASDRTAVEPPDVPFQMLTALDLPLEAWKAIAQRAPWQTTRMNLNSFARHGVFEDAELTAIIADRLRNRELIEKARVFPYQLMIAYATAAKVPAIVRDALQDAMEIAIANVPKANGQVYVFLDISGSMHSPVTGHRRGSSSRVRCVDVAALVAAAMVRANPATVVVPFQTTVIPPESIGLNPRDSVMTNAQKLASLPAGGTNCSAPLAYLNKVKATGDFIIYVSDNESWIESSIYGRYGGSRTQTMDEWSTFKRRSPQARMICIDIQPNATTQAKERDDITNVGGFSDDVFNLIAAVTRGDASDGYWARQIETIRI